METLTIPGSLDNEELISISQAGERGFTVVMRDGAASTVLAKASVDGMPFDVAVLDIGGPKYVLTNVYITGLGFQDVEGEGQTWCTLEADSVELD